VNPGKNARMCRVPRAPSRTFVAHLETEGRYQRQVNWQK
jgi:hypothetical protein